MSPNAVKDLASVQMIKVCGKGHFRLPANDRSLAKFVCLSSPIAEELMSPTEYKVPPREIFSRDGGGHSFGLMHVPSVHNACLSIC